MIPTPGCHTVRLHSVLCETMCELNYCLPFGLYHHTVVGHLELLDQLEEPGGGRERKRERERERERERGRGGGGEGGGGRVGRERKL